MIKGYRGHGVEGETTVKVVGRLPKRMTHNWMRRRAAIESAIDHPESDHRLSHNYLKRVSRKQDERTLARSRIQLCQALSLILLYLDNRAFDDNKKPSNTLG